MSQEKAQGRSLLKKIAIPFLQTFFGPKGGRKGEIVPKSILMLGLGAHVRGNLSYLLDELNGSELFEGYRIYVRTTAETDKSVRSLIKSRHWDRTKTLSSDLGYYSLLTKVQYLLTETYFPEYWVKQPGQILIEIWHGTPIKKIGSDKKRRSCHRNGAAQKNFIDADVLLCPNDYTKEKLLGAYRVSELMHARLLKLGYPRTGGMLCVTDEKRESIREECAPGKEKIYVYMPTFRGYLPIEEESALIRSFLDEMENGLTERQILFVNIHHKVNLSLDFSRYEKIRPFPADLDSYQLLAASDALISDYSSVMFDYLALKRQIVLYIPDYETYKKKRGLYFDLALLPFDKAETGAEVLSALNLGKKTDDTKTYDSFCPCDSKENAKKLSRLFSGDEAGLTFEEIPKKDKSKVLIHTEWAKEGKATSLLSDLVQKRKDRTYDLYLSCNSSLTARTSGAYPMFRKVPVIGSSSSAVEFEQMVGTAVFDVIVIYDCEDPKRIRALAKGALQAKALLLFVQDSALEKLEAGNQKLLDAFSFAADRCVCILLPGEAQKERAARIFGEECLGKLTVAADARRLGEWIERCAAGQF